MVFIFVLQTGVGTDIHKLPPANYSRSFQCFVYFK